MEDRNNTNESQAGNEAGAPADANQQARAYVWGTSCPALDPPIERFVA